jgi:hypothetical protein
MQLSLAKLIDDAHLGTIGIEPANFLNKIAEIFLQPHLDYPKISL